MTDRHIGYVVVLEEAIREDDAKATIEAIKQIKGVLTVEPVIQNTGTMIAEAKAKSEIASGLSDTIRKFLWGDDA